MATVLRMSMYLSGWDSVRIPRFGMGRRREKLPLLPGLCGGCHRCQKHYKEALSHYKQALKLRQAVKGAEDAEVKHLQNRIKEMTEALAKQEAPADTKAQAPQGSE